MDNFYSCQILETLILDDYALILLFKTLDDIGLVALYLIPVNATMFMLKWLWLYCSNYLYLL